MNEMMLKGYYEDILRGVNKYSLNEDPAFFYDWIDLFESPEVFDEDHLMLALVFSWQQNSTVFNDALKKIGPMNTFWNMHFGLKKPCKLYRLVNIKRSDVEGELTKDNVDDYLKSPKDYEATTTSLDVYLDNDRCFNKGFKDEEYYKVLFEVTGMYYLNIDKYRDLGEKEVVVYKPQMEFIGLLDDVIEDIENEKRRAKRNEELVKGNQTLTEKVKKLEKALDEKDEIIKNLTVENYKLTSGLNLANKKLDQISKKLNSNSVDSLLKQTHAALLNFGIDASFITDALKEEK